MRFAGLLLACVLLPVAAAAQQSGGVCGAAGTIDECQRAVSLQQSDLVLGWQTSQAPHTRSMTIAQLIGASGAITTAGGTLLGRLAVAPATSDTADPTWLQSTYNVGYTDGTASRIHFNSIFDTHVNSVPGDSIWNLLAQLSTSTGAASVSGTQTQVALYGQAVRNSITGGAKGVALEGAVFELHDYVDGPSNVTGYGITAEFDYAGNGTDDLDIRGLQSLDLSQANQAGSDLIVGNGIGMYGGTHAYLKRAVAVNLPFAQAGFDTRNGTQLTGANAVWLADMQTIALSTNGRWAIRSNPAGATDLEFLYNGGVAAFIDPFSTISAPGGFKTSGAFSVNGLQVVGARDTGWGAATGGSKAAFTASTATLAQTAALVAQIEIALTAHGLIGP